MVIVRGVRRLVVPTVSVVGKVERRLGDHTNLGTVLSEAVGKSRVREEKHRVARRSSSASWRLRACVPQAVERLEALGVDLTLAT